LIVQLIAVVEPEPAKLADDNATLLLGVVESVVIVLVPAGEHQPIDG
jgi:hypothetical protein